MSERALKQQLPLPLMCIGLKVSRSNGETNVLLEDLQPAVDVKR